LLQNNFTAITLAESKDAYVGHDMSYEITFPKLKNKLLIEASESSITEKGNTVIFIVPLPLIQNFHR
jgi:hypothetical protein